MSGFVAVDKLILDIDARINKATSKIQGVDKELMRMDKTVPKVAKKLNSAFLGVGLSLLFTGMAIQRAADSFLKAITKSFMTARDEGDPLLNQFVGMQAALEFLKFSIFDTFAQSELFIPLTEAIINMVNGISQFVSKHPEIAAFLVTFAGFNWVIGGVISAFGQLFLAAVSLSAVLGIGLGAALIGIVGVILVVGIAFAWAMAILIGNGTKGSKTLQILGVALLAIAAIIGIVAGVLSLPVLIIGVILYLFGMLVKATGGVGNAFKFLGIFILRILAFVADSIMSLLLAPINLVIEAINLAIKASNALLGTNFKTIPTISFGLGSKVDDYAAKFKADVISQKDEKEAAKGGTTIINNVNGVFDEAGMQRTIDGLMQNSSNRFIGSTGG